MTKRATLLIVGLLLVSTSAAAGANWQTIGLSISLADAPKVLAALDELMSSEAPEGKGNVSLMVNVAGGSTSHTIISSFDTRAAREAWIQGLRTSKAWAKFGKATAGLTQPGETSRMNSVKSWGKESDEDVFWEIFAFTVTDSDGFSTAIDTLMASDTGKKFPGQVHLSGVAAAGMSPVTHLISVGFESEAEAETWDESMVETKDWASYQKASGMVSTFSGAFLIRTIKTWGGSD